MCSLDPEQENLKRTLETIMKDSLPPQLDEQMENAFQRFRENLPDHPYVQSLKQNPKNRSSHPWLWGWNLAWSAALMLIITIALPSMIGNGNPTWAEVTRQFKSIPFFHATVYAKNVTSSQAIQFEIWFGEGGKVRLRHGSQVVFASKQGIRKTYDILRRKETTPTSDVIHVVKILNSAESFSLETVIQTITGTQAELRPVPSRVEGVSEDLSIFDLIPENTTEQIRIWTLRESLLPIQLQQRNIENGESIDVFFSYLNQQPDSFFEPEPFAMKLRNTQNDPIEFLDAF